MSVARFQRLLQLTREHDPALYAWLSDGWAARRDGLPLEQALNLAGGVVRERNEALNRAAQLLAPGRSRWERAQKLAATIARVRRGICRTAAEREVQHALNCGRVPRSIEHLYRSVIRD